MHLSHLKTASCPFMQRSFGFLNAVNVLVARVSSTDVIAAQRMGFMLVRSPFAAVLRMSARRILLQLLATIVLLESQQATLLHKERAILCVDSRLHLKAADLVTNAASSINMLLLQLLLSTNNTSMTHTHTNTNNLRVGISKHTNHKVTKDNSSSTKHINRKEDMGADTKWVVP